MCQPGPTRAPRRFPGGLARLRRLPQHEIERIALGFVHLDARAGPQVGQALARQLAVRLELRDGVVHVAVAGRVGVALVDQRLHHRDDLRDELGRARLAIAQPHAERRAVFLVGLDEALGQRLHRLAVLLRALDDLVVDVRDVADERDVVARRLEVTAHDVEHDQHARMAEVAVVVDRDAADVHADLARLERLEDFLASGQRVLDLQHGIRSVIGDAHLFHDSGNR